MSTFPTFMLSVGSSSELVYMFDYSLVLMQQNPNRTLDQSHKIPLDFPCLYNIFFFLDFYLKFLLFTCEYFPEWPFPMCLQCSQRPEEGIKFPGSGLTVVTPHIGAGN